MSLSKPTIKERPRNKQKEGKSGRLMQEDKMKGKEDLRKNNRKKDKNWNKKGKKPKRKRGEGNNKS